MNNWRKDKKEISNFFLRFEVNTDGLYDHIVSLVYEKQQVIFYLFAKIRKVVKICDFLDSLKKDNNEDVDAIKVFFLVCHAEIAMSNLGKKGSKVDLVEEFFKPAENRYRLKYKIRPALGSGKEEKSHAWVLSAIRNEYAHTGEYTGLFFRSPNSDPKSYNAFGVYDRGKYVSVECQMTYKEFIATYMDALIENVKCYSQ